MCLRDCLQNNFLQVKEHLFVSQENGYWSNLNKEENRKLIGALENMTTREAINKYQGQLYEIIFSPKRQAGLELLDLSGNEICVDYGCMWGALTIPLAKRCKYVLGIDQTLDSLNLLNARLKEDKISNIDLLCGDLRKSNIFIGKSDIAVVNGVLEWIPEEGSINLRAYYGKYASKTYSINPKYKQLQFLKSVHQSLSSNGKIYLAIENRFDFKMFLGAKDPHANLLFTSLLPRKVADLISKIRLGRKYVNWLYSFNGIQSLLEESGFSKVDLYMCFPDYRFPERIIPYDMPLRNFRPTISLKNVKGKFSVKRFLARIAEFVFFGIFRAKYFAPSIIAIGYK